MKKKIINFIVILFTVIVFLEIIINNKDVYNIIKNSIYTWINVLVPSLFPFFIISDILIDYNIIKYIPKQIRLIMCKVFRISEAGLTILLLSLISGFPSNARNARTLYDKGKISEKEASYVLMFTHFSNPLFILTTVGLIFFKNRKLGIVILLSHYLANIILGIIIRGPREVFDKGSSLEKEDPDQGFGKILTNSIRHAIDTLLLIFGTLTIFLVIAGLIISKFNLSGYKAMAIKGILEMTMGLQELSLLKVSPLGKAIISSMMISFGGLSVHMQVLSQIAGTKIKYYYFLLGRIFQGIIAGVLAVIFYRIML